MTQEPVEVDPAVLRRVAGGLAAEAYGLAHGLAGASGLTVTGPEWRAGEALVRCESAVHAWLGVLAGEVADASTALETAAREYEAVDVRAADRLAGLPR